MKKLFTLFLFCASLQLWAQTGQWIWMNGTNALNPPGVYGTQGVASVNNSPPGLYQAVQWTDTAGNFWIFGGVQPAVIGIECADLWKYDPRLNTWTWVKGPGVTGTYGVYGSVGVPSILNQPGGRAWGCNSWTDKAGDLWLFGGSGFDAIGDDGTLNDLWRYNIASNEWTWMGGPPITGGAGSYGPLYQLSAESWPQAHCESETNWSVNNNLWFFGGTGDTSWGLSELWQFNIDTNEWAWMGTPGPASYGILGVESPTNAPESRVCYTHWTIGDYLYIYGGWGTSGNLYNDVWRFNIDDNLWAWVGGDTGNVDIGQYLRYCSMSSNNYPTGLLEQRSVQLGGCDQALLSFGGFDSVPNTYNGLWRFNPAAAQWEWLSGDDSLSPTGNFGVMGVAAPGNKPPGLGGPCFWADNNRQLWVWGGWFDGANQTNAMWKYIPDWSCIGIDSGSSLTYQISRTNLCANDSAIITVGNGTGFSITPNNNVTWIDSTHAVIKPDSSTSYILGGYTDCGDFDTLGFTIQVLNASPVINSNKSIICPSDSAQICAPVGYSSYLWNTGATTNCITANQAGNYYVTVSESGCSATSNRFGLSVYSVSSLAITQSGDTLMAYNSTTYQWYLNGTAIPGADSSIYIATEPGSYTLQVTDSNGCIAVSNPQIISGVNDVEAGSISVYPNPTNTSWQLNVTPQLIGSIAEVFDVTGKLVFKSQINNQQSTINIPEASKGIYLLRITSVNFVATKELEKM